MTSLKEYTQAILTKNVYDPRSYVIVKPPSIAFSQPAVKTVWPHCTVIVTGLVYDKTTIQFHQTVESNVKPTEHHRDTASMRAALDVHSCHSY